MDLYTGNFENELYYAIDSKELNNTGFLSSYFYINTNDTWTYPMIKLVLAITNYKNKAALNKHINLPVLTYTNNSHFTPLNNWDNPNYFTAIFPILFFWYWRLFCYK